LLAKDALLDQPTQALVEDVARDAEALLQLVEAPHPEEGVPDDQHRPPVADDLEALSHRAVHVSEALALHGSRLSGLHDRTQWLSVRSMTELASRETKPDTVVRPFSEVTALVP